MGAGRMLARKNLLRRGCTCKPAVWHAGASGVLGLLYCAMASADAKVCEALADKLSVSSGDWGDRPCYCQGSLSAIKVTLPEPLRLDVACNLPPLDSGKGPISLDSYRAGGDYFEPQVGPWPHEFVRLGDYDP